MIHNLSKNNSLVSQWMHELRSVSIQNDRMRFRRNLERIGEVSAYEISKLISYKIVNTETTLGTHDCSVIETQPVIATILRAGVPLQQGLLNYFDHADAAFVAAYRKHHKDGSFSIAQNYITAPEISNRDLILTDPMIATGSSIILAIEGLLELGTPKSIHIVTAISCTQGLEKIKRKYPKVHVWTGDVDDELTAKAYIVPGLGDAGDLAFGNKTQS